MKIKYLGTGAGDGIPTLFCNCRVCEESKKMKGRNIRMRCCAAVNETVFIDFSQDIFMQNILYDLPLCDTRAIFITHSHIDHLASEELCLRYRWYSNLGDKPLNIYGNKECIAEIKRQLYFDTRETELSYYVYHELVAYESVQIGELTITPIPANHMKDEQAFIFLIEENDKAFLYCNDTGVLPYESVEFLKGKKLSGIGMDCTYGFARHSGNTHMGLGANKELKQKLFEQKSADDSTEFIAIHFSHSCEMTHDELIEQEKEITIGYDGIELEY